MQGQGATGLAQMEQGMAAALATGYTSSRSRWLVPLAAAAGHVDQVEDGLHLLAEALRALEASRGDLLAETYCLQGSLLLWQAVPAMAQAEVCFQQALAMARHQQAKSWELRAATSTQMHHVRKYCDGLLDSDIHRMPWNIRRALEQSNAHGSHLGSDIHVMLALCRGSRQVVVADEELNGPDMVGELFGKGQRVADQL
jgi:hypothetical protein